MILLTAMSRTGKKSVETESGLVSASCWGRMDEATRLKGTGFALASVTQIVGNVIPVDGNVTGSIPIQGTCLGCRFGPWSVSIREVTNQYFSFTSMFLSLPSPLSKIKEHVLRIK